MEYFLTLGIFFIYQEQKRSLSQGANLGRPKSKLITGQSSAYKAVGYKYKIFKEML